LGPWAVGDEDLPLDRPSPRPDPRLLSSPRSPPGHSGPRPGTYPCSIRHSLGQRLVGPFALLLAVGGAVRVAILDPIRVVLVRERIAHQHLPGPGDFGPPRRRDRRARGEREVGAKLFRGAHEVVDAPVLGDLPIPEAEELDPGDDHLPVGRRYAQV